MEPILEIKNLNSFYRQGGSAFSKGKTVQVLKNVNLTIGQGEVLGLVVGPGRHGLGGPGPFPLPYSSSPGSAALS